MASHGVHGNQETPAGYGSVRSWVLAACSVWLLAGIATSVSFWVSKAPKDLERLIIGQTLSVPERLLQASGLDPVVQETVRASLPDYGLLILFSPRDGPRTDLPRYNYGEAIRNLVYPHPERVVVATSRKEGAELVGGEDPGSVLVLEFFPTSDHPVSPFGPGFRMVVTTQICRAWLWEGE